jgi:hypothetical protein
VHASPPSRTTGDGVNLAAPTDVPEEPGEASPTGAVRRTRSANPRFSSPKSFKGTWIRCFLAVFFLCVAWVLATPLGAAPDEPAQIVKAAATVRGENIGRPAPKEPAAVRQFRVPAVFDSIYNLPICYQFHPPTPAGCAPHVRSSGRIITSTSYVGRYPPLYYAAVGLPTLVMHSESVVYFMRLIGAFMDALLLSLALAIAALWCRSTMLFEAIALAVTPMVIFLTGVINPSGFEIAAAICAWTSGLALVRNGSLRPRRSLLVAFVVSGCLLELTRGLSVLWMGLIVLTLIAFEPRKCWQLARHWSVRVGMLLLFLIGAVAVVFVLTARTLKVLPSSAYPPNHGALIPLTEHVLGLFGGYMRQIIGVFGWLDTPSPLFTTFAWTALLGFLLVLGISVSRRREAVVLVGLLVGSVIITVALIDWNAGTAGITWQARDGLPLYVGIPLLAGISIPKRSVLGFGETVGTRMAGVLAAVIGLCQLADFLWTLRRYTVGLGRTVNLFQTVKHGWSPPPGIPWMVVLGTVAVVLYSTLLFNRMRR